jgi:asparagine synthase (glutamine-hydrolysing)
LGAVQIHIRDSDRWHEFGAFRSRGTAFLSGRLLTGEALSQQLATSTDGAQLRQTLCQLNGLFSAIGTLADGQFAAAVDRTRSMPLFYGRKDGKLFLSDDARWVRQQVDDLASDPVSELEFELAGYITGPDTLHARVKQLQAGELLLVAADGAPGVTTERYFRYEHEEGPARSEDELRKELDAILVRAFERFVTLAHGRTIVVPLSGGYDSRLIAVMLKQLGYDNVVAYSYGRRGNEEAVVSRRVAANLGIRWEFTEYSEELWRRWWRTPEREEYGRFADGLCSVPVYQEWPAVWELKRRGLVPDDAIFAPGHSADAFPASRRTIGRADVYRDAEVVRETVIAAILRYTYSLWDWRARRAELAPLVMERIDAALGDLSRFHNSACAVEAWGIQERQAKFIVNAMRAYESWGYDWWLPFWDAEFAQFWMRCPVELRIGRRFSRSHIRELYQRVSGTEHQRSKSSWTASGLSMLAAWGRAVGSRIPLLGRLYERLRAPLKYRSHPLAWYGIVPRKVFLERFRGSVNINSFLALEWLGRLRLGSADE